ncbi:MAG: N-acetylglucosamine-6-phosphate deacetylase [Lachnospiraceae bacterium]|nr:N-acetylglucosamine-6-phosphate deacetylase [Lachnospiraceae bacterium]
MDVEVNYFKKLDRKMVRGKVFCADGKFRQGTVILEDNEIVDVDFSLADLNGGRIVPTKYILPGLIDIHMHGANGIDGSVASIDDLVRLDKYEREHGVVSYLLATMTLPLEQIDDVCQNIAGAMASGEVFGLRGAYIEGPFINKNKCGAQNSENALIPSEENADKLISIIDKCRRVRCVALAPELGGSEQLIRTLSDKGVIVSIAHTEADYNQAIAGFEAGASQVTHLYNAMSSFNHRNPGVVGAAFDKSKYVELIADGYHVNDAVVRSTFAMFGDDRVILVSDSTMATGLDEGNYWLGDNEIIVKGNKAVLKDDEKVLAGSASNLFDCMVSAIKMGVDPAKAVKAATINPAKRLNIDMMYGSIEKGKMPGLIVTNDKWEIEQVIL